MLIRLLRAVLSIALVFGAVWTAVIWNWQVTHRYPTPTDIVLKLLVLPAGVVAGYWALRRLFGFARASWSKAGTAAAPASTTAAAAEEAPDAADERAFHMFMLASAVRLPLGADAEAVLAALEAGTSPGLDAVLKDGDGLPVFASRVAGVAVDELRTAIASLPAPPGGWSEEQLRALVLADALVEDLASQAAALVASASAGGNAEPPPLLRTLFLFPDHWPEQAVRSADRWLRHRTAQSLWAQAQVLGEAIRVRDGYQALAALDGLSAVLNRNQATDLCLVLACNSDVGEETLLKWTRAGTLMSSMHSQGRIPGEGSAALLLTAATDAAKKDNANKASVTLHRAALGKREHSADEQARVNGETVKQLCEQALLQASVDAGTVTCLLSDADHRQSRAVEVGSLFTALFTEVAPQRCYALESGCGHLGATAAIAALALGAARVAAEQKSAGVISVADGIDRAALVLSSAPVAA